MASGGRDLRAALDRLQSAWRGVAPDVAASMRRTDDVDLSRLHAEIGDHPLLGEWFSWRMGPRTFPGALAERAEYVRVYDSPVSRDPWQTKRMVDVLAGYAGRCKVDVDDEGGALYFDLKGMHVPVGFGLVQLVQNWADFVDGSVVVDDFGVESRHELDDDARLRLGMHPVRFGGPRLPELPDDFPRPAEPGWPSTIHRETQDLCDALIALRGAWATVDPTIGEGIFRIGWRDTSPLRRYLGWTHPLLEEWFSWELGDSYPGRNWTDLAFTLGQMVEMRAYATDLNHMVLASGGKWSILLEIDLESVSGSLRVAWDFRDPIDDVAASLIEFVTRLASFVGTALESDGAGSIRTRRPVTAAEEFRLGYISSRRAGVPPRS